MLKFSKDSYVDVDLYESRLKRDGYIVIDTEKMRSIRDYMDNVTNSLAELARTIMAANSGNMYSRLSKDNIYNYLIGMEGVPERRTALSAGVVRLSASSGKLEGAVRTQNTGGYHG